MAEARRAAGAGLALALLLAPAAGAGPLVAYEVVGDAVPRSLTGAPRDAK